MKLIMTWVTMILGGWLAVYGIYLATVWSLNAMVDAIDYEQSTRSEQVQDRVSSNALDYYLRRK